MALAAQVAGLKEINEALKKYLEAVMTGAGPDASTKLIPLPEEKRLDELKQYEAMKSNNFCIALSSLVSLEQFYVGIEGHGNQ